MRYTTRQRNHESSLTRYRWVLTKERRSGGIEALETELSLQTCRTTNKADFLSYIAAKRACDEQMRSFYRQPKWRRWKFRIFCRRKTSEARFLHIVADTYGPDCTVYLGDWCRRDQMKGCAPSPTVGLKKMLRRKFKVYKVDEYKTSRICNRCKSELSTYKKRDGKNSYSRLCCHGCRSNNKLSKRFVDRDLNAATNILLAGTSTVRPLSMSRPKAGCVRKRASPSNSSCDVLAKMTCLASLLNHHLAVGPARPSSDPFPATSKKKQESSLLDAHLCL